MSYQKPPPGPKHNYSSSSDPFNNQNVQQLDYDPNSAQPANPYTQGVGGPPNPGAGGAGVGPATQGGQYAPYYDNERQMDARYDGGGMGRETWASESGWSGNGMSIHFACIVVYLEGERRGEKYEIGNGVIEDTRLGARVLLEGSARGKGADGCWTWRMMQIEKMFSSWR